MPPPSNPTCPDCRRPFKTHKGLSIQHNQCPKRETQRKQKQRPHQSGPQSEREEGASNGYPGDDNSWVDRKLNSG